MSQFITEQFVPVQIHIKEQPETFDRFGAHWTPTLIVAEPDGTERHRFVGFFPPADFLAQLELSLAKGAFERGEFAEAERRYREIADAYSETEAAPEAIYWTGVSAYKAQGAPEPLKEAAARLKERYPESSWAKKAMVWAG